MENVTRVGVDLSKNVFHFHGANHAGRKVFRKRVYRADMERELRQLPRNCEVVMEASGSSHYWARKVEELGLKAKQIPAQRVKAFVSSQKNDFNDAEAICEAADRPNMRFVPTKSVKQQELQALHRIRQRLIGNRTALINQIRGLLSEHGIVLPRGVRVLRKELLSKISVYQEQLSIEFRDVLIQLHSELLRLDEGIKSYECRLERFSKLNPVAKRLLTVPGIGLLTATALVSACGDTRAFRNGRHFAAWLGLVPKQVTTGGEPKLLGITKRGDVYLRTLLIHGARAVVQRHKNKDDKLNLWVKKLFERKGPNLTAVALANKNARIAWRLMTFDEVFCPQLPSAV